MEEKLKEFLKNAYDPEAGAKTSLWSQGNDDDVFSDGEFRGYAMALHEVATLLGIEVEPLHEQDFS